MKSDSAKTDTFGKEKGQIMFEYVCDHIIPGCTHKEQGDTRESTLAKALEHLHQHHGMEEIDKNTMERVMTSGIVVQRNVW